MRVLIVNQAFYPDESATAQYCVDLACALQDSGHEVTVLSSDRGYLDPQARFVKEEEYRGVKIVRVSAPALSWRYRILRMLDAFLLNCSLLLGFFRLGEFDCTICLTSPPLLGAFLGVHVPRSKGRLVHWAMDINPDQAIRAGWIKESGVLATVLFAAQKNFYRRCDAIVVLDSYMQALLQKKGIMSQRICIVPLWWDASVLTASNADVEKLKEQIGVPGKQVVMYAGNHSLCHPLTAMLEAARLLSDNEKIVFLFAGGGSRVSEVADFKKRHSLENIVQIPHQPREHLPALLKAADVQVVSCGDDFVGVVHPSKVYPFIALDKPFILIGKQESSVGEIIKQGAAGAVVDAADGEAFRDAVTRLLADPVAHAPELRERFKDATVLKEFVSVLTR